LILGWNAAFNGKATLANFGMKRMTNYKDHLIDFFKFYKNHDFEGSVICPYLGQAIPLRRYCDAHKVGTDDEPVIQVIPEYMKNIRTFREAKVNVADMLNLNYNVGYNVGIKRLRKFKVFCGEAVELLRENLQNPYEDLTINMQSLKF
jgi:hypothetical protein